MGSPTKPEIKFLLVDNYQSIWTLTALIFVIYIQTNLKEKKIMFCFQCQEAFKGQGCVTVGVCGKNETVANLQDLLIYATKGISVISSALREKNKYNGKADKFIFENLFMTITNVNFDENTFFERIKEALYLRDSLKEEAVKNEIIIDDKFSDAVNWKGETISEFLAKAVKIGIRQQEEADKISLKELLIYGIKGIAAYAVHSLNLGFKNDEIIAFVEKGMKSTIDSSLETSDLLNLVIECGKYGVDVLALLDKANTTAYGNPEVTKVTTRVGKNPGILVTGHDLKDMEDLLKQTEGTGIDVYTHSEMLPTHYYPEFKKFKHLVGNYGGAWWQQTEDFESFNGPVLFTTNCLVPPLDSYKDRLFTTGAVGYPGMKHIPESEEGNPKDFSAMIELAKQCKPPVQTEDIEIIGGFAHQQVMNLADKVIEAVKAGSIKKFVVMAGCDGRSSARDYYTEFANNIPDDSVILTAGCAKYRYNKLPLGDINGIPRVLDAGQCNDSYSLALTAIKLKEVFGLNDINDLPIIYNISWYEQKAVIVLLALLYLGVKNIHLGPTLPAFLSPGVAKVLVENFGIAGITDVENDLKIFYN